jgi:hypothetical protein
LKQRRGEQTRPPVTAHPARAAAFVEVSPEVRRAATTDVELQRPDGTRVRITSPDAAPALALLLQVLLEGR